MITKKRKYTKKVNFVEQPTISTKTHHVSGCVDSSDCDYVARKNVAYAIRLARLGVFIPVILFICAVVLLYFSSNKPIPVTQTKPIVDKPAFLVVDLGKAFSDTLEAKDILMNIAYKYNPRELELKNKMSQAEKEKDPKLPKLREQAMQEINQYQQEIEKIKYDAYGRFLERIIPIMEKLNPDKLPVLTSGALYTKTNYVTDLTNKVTEEYNKAIPVK
jgi:hypothetical protein